jgi:hypothetical protein
VPFGAAAFFSGGTAASTTPALRGLCIGRSATEPIQRQTAMGDHIGKTISETNYNAGITHHGGGIFTLQFVGTVGAVYYVETTTNLIPPTVWEALPGSTNLVTDPDGHGFNP